GDALGGDVRQRLLDALDDRLGRVDLGEADVDAAEADLHVGGQLAEDGDVAGDGDAELEHELLDLEPADVFEDGFVAAGGAPATPAPVSPAQVHRQPHALDAVEDGVEPVDGPAH